MNINRFAQVASLAGVALFMSAANARAAPITFNASTSAFAGGSTTLNSSSGAAATLTFVPVGNTNYNTPTNVNYGNFTLVCTACTNPATPTATFNAFTFNLIVTDVTDGNATGQFVGTGSGSVGIASSTIDINWAPLVLGPGTFNATSGNFGPTSFIVNSTTRIVAPNSGGEIGSTTVQGAVTTSTVPEPTTFGLVGMGFLGLGLLRRKKRSA